MTTKIIECTIKGISPLLMNFYSLAGRPDGFDKLTPEEQAKAVEYRDQQGNLFVPGVNIQRCLIAAAVYSKGKNRASLQKPVAACVLVNPERIILDQQNYEIDGRRVVVPSTKGRVPRYRPRFNNWQLAFQIEYDPVLLKETEMRNIVDNAGSRVGLLDFRPEKKGPFGRFIVIERKS